jgi:hypothetical protein
MLLCAVPIYRLHDTTGDDLGLLEHPAPNIEPGDVVVVADGREAIVTARVEAEPGWGQLVALLEVAIAHSRLEADDAPVASARLRIEERERGGRGRTSPARRQALLAGAVYRRGVSRDGVVHVRPSA